MKASHILTIVLAAFTGLFANAGSDVFVVNKTNGLQQRVSSTQITFNADNQAVLTEGNIPVSEIAEIKRAAASEIALNLSNVDNHSFTIDVVPDDSNRKYVAVTIEKSEYDKCKNAEDVHAIFWKVWQEWADLYGMSPEEYVELFGVLSSGENRELLVQNLDPSTDYVFCALYTDNQGHLDGVVNALPVRTSDVEMIDMTFDVDITLSGKVVRGSVSPSDKKHRYFQVAIDDANIQRLGNGDPIKALKGYLEEYRGFFGKTREEFFPLATVWGDHEIAIDNLDTNTDHIFFACALDSAMNICSAVKQVPFRTGEIVPSDNQITATVKFVATKRGLIDIKTTNKDPYIIRIMSEAERAGRSAEELIAAFEAEDTPSELFFNSRRNGDSQLYNIELTPDTEYCAIVFGYQSASLDHYAPAEVTTEPIMLSFKTPATAAPVAEMGFIFMDDYYNREEGASVAVVGSEPEYPFFCGCSASTDPEAVMAEVNRKATDAGMSLNDYLKSTQSMDVGFTAFFLPGFWEELGFPPVEEGTYYPFAIGLNSDGSPATDVWFGKGYKIFDTRSTSPAKSAEKEDNKSMQDKFLRSIAK